MNLLDAWNELARASEDSGAIREVARELSAQARAKVCAYPSMDPEEIAGLVMYKYLDKARDGTLPGLGSVQQVSTYIGRSLWRRARDEDRRRVRQLGRADRPRPRPLTRAERLDDGWVDHADIVLREVAIPSAGRQKRAGVLERLQLAYEEMLGLAKGDVTLPALLDRSPEEPEFRTARAALYTRHSRCRRTLLAWLDRHESLGACRVSVDDIRSCRRLLTLLKRRDTPQRGGAS